MAVDIREIGVESLSEYAQVPIAFEQRSILRVDLVDDGLRGMRLHEETLPTRYVDDYDSLGEGPQIWPELYDLAKWGFFLAKDQGRPVAGATLAFDTPGIHVLSRRRDLAALWDIRVHPDYRRRGIGTELIRCAAAWSRSRGCDYLKIETQNTNVSACRFYVAQGCTLGQIDLHGYAHDARVAHQAMMIWYLRL